MSAAKSRGLRGPDRRLGHTGGKRSARPAGCGIVLLALTLAAPAAWSQGRPVVRPVLPPVTIKAPPPKPPLPRPAPKAPAPPPDVWQASEIADARRVCQQALASMTAEIEELAPVKNGRCGAPAPVRLISIGKLNPVKFVPAPTISCRMLVPLKRWIEKGLQPHAARQLDGRVTRIEVMSSYSCRTRYGRKGAKMSEHAFANALDIGGFRLADGRRVSVLKDWGPTKRDIAKALLAAKQKKEAAAAAANAPAAAAPAPAPTPPASPKTASARPKPAPPPTRLQPRQPPESQSRQRATASQRNAQSRRLVPLPAEARRQLENLQRFVRVPGLPRRTTRIAEPAPTIIPPLPTRRPLRQAVRRRLTDNRTGPTRVAPERLPPFAKPPYRLGGPKTRPSASHANFLRGIHQTACRIFGTTLGPEANEAHRNHFHFDMFPRRNRPYCE